MESSWRRAWGDTERFRHTAGSFWGLEIVGASVSGLGGGYVGFLLTPTNATDTQSFLYPAIGAVGGVIFGLGIVFLGIYMWYLFRAPYKQRNEVEMVLDSIPGATPNSPRVALPELFFEDIDCKFIGDNPPLLLIEWTVMPTGSMHLEQAKIEILGGSIPFTDWETCDVSPSITFGFANHCEIKGKLPTGNHDIRIQVFANRQWWASDWQTITYSPSIPDKEGSQTE